MSERLDDQRWQRLKLCIVCGDKDFAGYHGRFGGFLRRRHRF